MTKQMMVKSQYAVEDLIRMTSALVGWRQEEIGGSQRITVLWSRYGFRHTYGKDRKEVEAYGDLVKTLTAIGAIELDAGVDTDALL